jgi:hypothetical protein
MCVGPISNSLDTINQGGAEMNNIVSPTFVHKPLANRNLTVEFKQCYAYISHNSRWIATASRVGNLYILETMPFHPTAGLSKRPFDDSKRVYEHVGDLYTQTILDPSNDQYLDIPIY